MQVGFANPALKQVPAAQQTLAALLEQFKPTPTPEPDNSDSMSQEELLLMLLQKLNESETSAKDAKPVDSNAFTTEQLQQLMIMLNTYGVQSPPQQAPVPQPEVIMPTEVVEPEPVDCYMDKARLNQPYTCSTEDLDSEFSIKIVWQPRIATHIAGIGAKGYFVEVRVEITNLTDKPWNGLRAASFSLIEDFFDSNVSIPFNIHEEVTQKKSRSYEMNQLKDVIQAGQTVSYFLVFDVSTEGADQTLVFRAIDRSGRKALIRMILPLPKYIPVEIGW